MAYLDKNTDPVGKVKAEVKGTQLRKMLNELHSDENLD